MKPDKKQMKTVYGMGRRYIKIGEKGGWIRHDWWEQEPDAGMHEFFGHCWLRQGFLFLTSWSLHGFSQFRSVEERDADLETTPPWPLDLARWGWDQKTLIDCRDDSAADLNQPEAKAAWQKIHTILYSPCQMLSTRRHLKESQELLAEAYESDKQNPIGLTQLNDNQREGIAYTRAAVQAAIEYDLAALAEWERQGHSIAEAEAAVAHLIATDDANLYE
jgi:hypothetical protein